MQERIREWWIEEGVSIISGVTLGFDDVVSSSKMRDIHFNRVLVNV